MRIIIQKFGGTSVASEDNRLRVAQRIIEAIEAGLSPVVVISAMGRSGDPYATDTLLSLIRDYGELPKRDIDLLLSCGEIISCSVITATLNRLHQNVVILTGREAGIITDDNYGNARIIRIEPHRVLNHLREGSIVVVAGFQGVNELGEITTLGRGGSDTTACALGAALNAEVIDIFTDVEGIMTADPRIVESARLLDRVTYNEICQLAYQGAKVIHPRAVEMAMHKNIPIRVRSTFSNTPGTLVSNHSEATETEQSIHCDRVITGITQMANVFQIKVETDSYPETSAAPSIIFRSLAEAGISVDLINVQPEIIAFTVDSTEGPRSHAILTERGFKVKVLPGCAKVSVVGGGMAGLPGVMASISEALFEQDITILQSADSHTTIWCLVKNDEMNRAVRALHDKFSLEK